MVAKMKQYKVYTVVKTSLTNKVNIYRGVWAYGGFLPLHSGSYFIGEFQPVSVFGFKESSQPFSEFLYLYRGKWEMHKDKPSGFVILDDTTGIAVVTMLAPDVKNNSFYINERGIHRVGGSVFPLENGELLLLPHIDDYSRQIKYIIIYADENVVKGVYTQLDFPHLDYDTLQRIIEDEKRHGGEYVCE